MKLLKRLFSITLIIRLQFYNVLRYVNIALVKGRVNNFIKKPLIFLPKVKLSILEFTYFLTAITNKIIAKTNFVNLTKSISSENLVFI